MGNHEFWTRLECDRLWRHPASPEDRHLARMNGDGVAIIGSTQVNDPDGLWTAGVEGSAMSMRIACRQLAGQLDLCFRDRAHGNYHRSVEAAGRTAGEIGDEHRHQGTAFHITYADPRVHQSVFEGQAAAEQEGDEIVAPEVADFSSLLNQLAPTVDAVAR